MASVEWNIVGHMPLLQERREEREREREEGYRFSNVPWASQLPGPLKKQNFLLRKMLPLYPIFFSSQPLVKIFGQEKRNFVSLAFIYSWCSFASVTILTSPWFPHLLGEVPEKYDIRDRISSNRFLPTEPRFRFHAQTCVSVLNEGSNVFCSFLSMHQRACRQRTTTLPLQQPDVPLHLLATDADLCRVVQKAKAAGQKTIPPKGVQASVAK